MGSYRPVRFTSILGKVMGKILLESISKHMKDKNVTRSSQHIFTKEIYLIAFCSEVTSFVDDKGTVHVVYLDFSRQTDKVQVR